MFFLVSNQQRLLVHLPVKLTCDAIRDCHFRIGMWRDKTRQIIQDGAENEDVQRKWVQQKVTFKYHTNPNWVPQGTGTEEPQLSTTGIPTEYHRNPNWVPQESQHSTRGISTQYHRNPIWIPQESQLSTSEYHRNPNSVPQESHLSSYGTQLGFLWYSVGIPVVLSCCEWFVVAEAICICCERFLYLLWQLWATVGHRNQRIRGGSMAQWSGCWIYMPTCRIQISFWSLSGFSRVVSDPNPPQFVNSQLVYLRSVGISNCSVFVCQTPKSEYK